MGQTRHRNFFTYIRMKKLSIHKCWRALDGVFKRNQVVLSMAFAYSWSLVIGHTVTGNLSLVFTKLAEKAIFENSTSNSVWSLTAPRLEIKGIIKVNLYTVIFRINKIG